MATLTDAIGKADAARKTTGPPPGVDAATGEVAESAQPAAPAKAKAKRSPKAAAQAAAEVNVLVASAFVTCALAAGKRSSRTSLIPTRSRRWNRVRFRFPVSARRSI